MISCVVGEETTCVLQLLARLPISMSSDGIGSSSDIRTTRLTCASSWSSGDLTGWARSMSRLWRDTCRSDREQIYNEGAQRGVGDAGCQKDGCSGSKHAAVSRRTTFTAKGRQGQGRAVWRKRGQVSGSNLKSEAAVFAGGGDPCE
jgi:hypothetical protein